MLYLAVTEYLPAIVSPLLRAYPVSNTLTMLDTSSWFKGLSASRSSLEASRQGLSGVVESESTVGDLV
jgi:hypothetical protein